MTLERAIRVLNERKHRNATGWRPGYHIEDEAKDEPGIVCVFDSDWLSEFEAIAVAEKYEGDTIVKVREAFDRTAKVYMDRNAELQDKIDSLESDLAKALEDNSSEYLRGRKAEQFAKMVDDFSWKDRAVRAERKLDAVGVDSVGLVAEHYLLSEIAALANPEVQAIIDMWVEDHEFLTKTTTPIRVLTTNYARGTTS